jgi:hypothetical protein
MWHACKVDGVTLTSMIAHPSRALFQAMACAERTAGEIRSIRAKMNEDDTAAAYRAQQHQRKWV